MNYEDNNAHALYLLYQHSAMSHLNSALTKSHTSTTQTPCWFYLQALFHYHNILGLYSITDYKVLLRDLIG